LKAKPTNYPAVHLEEIPPQMGAVHRYHGSMNDDYGRELAAELAARQHYFTSLSFFSTVSTRSSIGRKRVCAFF
jgi:hypothetical protein